LIEVTTRAEPAINWPDAARDSAVLRCAAEFMEIGAAGPIKVKTATVGDLFENGQAFVAFARHHLFVENGRLRLSRGPRENWYGRNRSTISICGSGLRASRHWRGFIGLVRRRSCGLGGCKAMRRHCCPESG
jgi:hypothetical protein